MLAFNPVQDVIDFYCDLKAKLNSTDETEIKIMNFYLYLEGFYIGLEETFKTGRGRGVKTVVRRKTPMFPMELWNIHSRINDCLPRTNNFVET